MGDKKPGLIKKFNTWTNKWMEEHPFWVLIFAVIVTIYLIFTGQYLLSIIYIALIIALIIILVILRLKTTEDKNVLKKVGHYIALFIAFVYSFAGVMRFVPCEYLILSINEWVIVFSTIFAGYLTMYGVWYSVEESKNENQRTLALQAIPLIVIDLDPTRFISELKYPRFDKDTDKAPKKIGYRFFFEIKNDHLNIASKVEIEDISFEIINEETDFTMAISEKELAKFRDDLLRQMGTISLLPSKFSQIISAVLPIKLHGLLNIEIAITLKYSDVYDKITHRTKSIINLYFNIDSSVTTHNITSDIYKIGPSTKFEFIE